MIRVTGSARLDKPATSALRQRIDAAMGRTPCDYAIRRVKFLDVFTCSWREGDVSVAGGAIVGIEPGLKALREIDGKGRWLVPGFIDAHVHVESSLLTPAGFESVVLPRGTTTAICDPHELANVVGIDGIRYFLDSASGLALDLRVMLSSCVPATHFETNGGGTISAVDLLPLLSHPQALGLAEMMNVPGVIHGDPSVLEKLEAFSRVPIDGHCPLVSGQALSAYASAGISSCHESSRLDEASEKLTKGISVWIREGSVAKDLRTLIPLLTLATSTSIGFCTDDRNPLDIAEQGHVDYLVREAIHLGVRPEVAYRSASWSVARHYRLTRKGAIAPGYDADLVLLDDAATCAVRSVFHKRVSGGVAPRLSTENTVRAAIPEEAEFLGPSGHVHIIGVEPGKIITTHQLGGHDSPGVARLTVLERHGRGSKPANAYVRGFGEAFHGAIASSVGHDSHNLIVAGSNPRDMRVALSALAESGGGFCVAREGSVLSRLALPLGGLMTTQDPAGVTQGLRDLREAGQATGCALAEPFLQLAFLSLPVIPALKLTDRGLVDVERFEMIDVQAP